MVVGVRCGVVVVEGLGREGVYPGGQSWRRWGPPGSGSTAGVSASLLNGLLINQRMASLKQAKLFLNQAKEDQQILVNKILYNASLSYFNWLKTYNEQKVYQDFLVNAEIRFNGTKKAFLEGLLWPSATYIPNK